MKLFISPKNSSKLAIIIIFWILIPLSSLITYGNTEKILSLAFWSTKSHKITYEPLLEALAARGHNVTVVSPIPSKKSIKNLHEILTVDIDEYFAQVGLPDFFEIKEKDSEKFNPLGFTYLVHGLCDISYNQPQVMALRKEKFDLIILPILFNECSAGFAYGFNTTTILVSPLSAMGQITTIFGTPSPPSFVPNSFTSYTDKMTFYQRTANFIMETFFRTIYNFKYIPQIEHLYREKLNDSNIPNLETILKNASLILSNSHFSMNPIRPFLPDIIEVGGMHISRNVKPLPDELEEFINSSGSHGFILFSLGSALRGSMMPDHKRKEILNAFGKLKQNVLWKWESETMSDLPKNVKLKKWLPQQDLLAHPKIKIFITHGGLGSTTEAIFHGVPLIGVPMFGDQNLNMEKAEKSGFAITLEYKELNEQNLFKSINEIVNNQSYKRNVERLSMRLKDQPMDPLERAIFWTEYVIRHKGAIHLRSSARDLNFCQYHSLDTIGFIAVLIFISIWLTYIVLRWIFFKVFFSFRKSKLSTTLRKKTS